MSIAAEKRLVRQRALELRRSISDRSGRSEQLAEQLLASGLLATRSKVAAYVALGDEAPTDRLLETLWQRVEVSLPVVCDEALELWAVADMRELEIGTFGIHEPGQELRRDASRRRRPEELDLVLVPGVAFDVHGGRLGYGKGHYDRLLDRLPPLAPRVGVAFDEQVLERVPQEPHDVSMTHLLTPGGVRTCD